MHRILFAFVLAVTAMTWAQESNSSANAAAQDPGDEIGKLKKNCPFQHVIGCAEVLFTGQPIHIAAGSIAPQNGVAAGLAYVGHKPLTNWRTTWNADAVASSNASWRAGFYMKLIDTHIPDIGVQKGIHGISDSTPTELPEQPVINLYTQAISLNKLFFFGLGPNTTLAGRTVYGMTETIAGVSGVKPVYAPLHIGIYGEVNGRWTEIRPEHGQSSPSIEQIYTAATAPGLNRQPFFLQFGAGLRMRPSFHNDLYHLNYDFAYRPFVATSGPGLSFQRFTADLSHQISLYHTSATFPFDSNGPNDCIPDPTADRPRCPKVTTRDLEGSVGIRFFTALSFTPGQDTVPFYFQPTLGGSDLNGNVSLGSYPDYRFRAPNVLMLRESFEHSIWKLPVGVALFADQGKASLTQAALSSDPWRHSFSTGLTLRAGGFPQVYLLFSWGGKEGTHVNASLNTTLLGASARPELF